MKEVTNIDTTKLFKNTLLFGIFLYLSFMVLDYFALPKNFEKVWYIRVFIIFMATIMVFIVPHFQKTLSYIKQLFILQIFAGQIALIVMIAISAPSEVAYRSYHLGLMLLLYWSIATFRLDTIYSLTLGVLTLVLYNFVEIFVHKLTILDVNSMDFAWYISNNLNILMTIFIILVVANSMNKVYSKFLNIHKKLLNQHQRLYKKNSALEKAKKYAEKSDILKSVFLTNISHDIRTPLNSIVGFSQLLDVGDINKNTRQLYVDKIQNNSSQLLDIINSILEISKIESGYIENNHETFKLSELFDSIYSSFQKKQMNSNVFFQQPAIEFKHKDFFIDTDKIKLQQIISNLLNNSLKFTEKGEISFGFKKSKDKVVIFIHDTGIGIDDKKIKRIFERFVPTDENIEPQYVETGIGLAICKAYVNILNGKIWIESELQVGTSVFISLPIKVKR